MQINEINDLNVDNLATGSLNTDNTALSDTLDAPENYAATDYYERNSKIHKALTAAAAILTISTGVLTGGSVFSNSFITQPSIQQFETTVSEEEGNISYYLDIENKGPMSVILTLTFKDQEEPLMELDVTKTSIYEGTIENLAFNTEYTLSLIASNHVDYVVTLDYQDVTILKEVNHV